MATYNELAGVQLRGLCRALSMDSEFPSYSALQRTLFAGWGDLEVPAEPPYASMIGDDHSPYEYSLAFGSGGVELRLLLEAQAGTPSVVANAAAALDLNQVLAARYGVDLRRFDAVRDLFLPAVPNPPFTLWHAVCLNSGKPPEFKIYMNPQAQGAENAPELLREAFARLGLGSEAWALLQRVGYRGAQLDELRYFSLDLSRSSTARVKAYYCHHRAQASELERAFAVVRTHVAGDVLEFCRVVAEDEGPFLKKSLSSCVSFSGSSEPSAVTLHFPIAHYVDSDAVAARRIRTFLEARGLSVSAYERSLTAFARRSVMDGRGLHSYASYRRTPAGMRLTTYLSPELFGGSEDEKSHSRLRSAADDLVCARASRKLG